MLPLDTLVTFFGLSLLLGFTPGPDNLFVLMQSATHGRSAGLWVVLGLCTGLLLQTAAVALGLAAVFAASAAAFTVLKMLGAAYLAYLAGFLGNMLRSSARAQRLMNRAAALVFAGLAARLALSQR